MMREKLPLDKPKIQPTSARDLIRLYSNGERDFKLVNLDGFDLAGANLSAASFYGASMNGTNFEHANLVHVQIKGAYARAANFDWANVNASDLIATDFNGASFRNAGLTGASMELANCTNADFSSAWLNNMSFGDTTLTNIKLTQTKLASVNFDAVDLTEFCDAKSLKHNGRSSIDVTSVMKSYRHPKLKQFMLSCGIPEVFATYMIDCAASLGEPLICKLMQSTFLSYGGPDEAFARGIYEALLRHNVSVFFFPENAKLGERIGDEVFRRIQEKDRVILVCSKQSLERPGVLHEIQETLDREARAGGATYLLPIMLDDYVLKGWGETHPDLAERLSRRVIGDFRGTQRNKAKFDKEMDRVIDALKKNSPRS